MSELICLIKRVVFKHVKIILSHVIKRCSWSSSRRRSRKSCDFRWSPPAASYSFGAMEASSQLKQVFRFLDANGDGKISPLELSGVLHSLGDEKYSAASASEEAQGIVKQMDCNGDGFIDLDEFMIAMMDSGTNKEEKKEEDEEGDVDLRNAFGIFDADKNGLISAEELRRVLGSLGCRNCSLRECRKMIKGVDRDGDGFVDFQEFKLMMNAGKVEAV